MANQVLVSKFCQDSVVRWPFLIAAVIFTGVTAPEGGYTVLPTSRTFKAGFDKVWTAVVPEISAFAPIKTIDNPAD